MVMKQAPTLAVMSAYNSWNRIPNSASHYLLTDVLRKEWGFKGYVYSDWGAIEMLKNFHFTARNSEEAALQALTAGLDVEASSDCYPAIPGLIERGELNREIVDEAVRRVLYAKFRIGLFDDPYGEKFAKGAIHSGKAIALSKKIAESGRRSRPPSKAMSVCFFAEAPARPWHATIKVRLAEKDSTSTT